MGLDAILTSPEYLSAVQADHGNVRRFLAGCRCDKCDRPAHHRFADSLEPWRQKNRVRWSTSA